MPAETDEARATTAAPHPRPLLATALSRGPAPSFPELAARYLEEYLAKISFALERLPPERLWWRPTPDANAAGNLLLHLCGNLTQWVLSGLGGQQVERHRAAEFAAREGAPKDELLKRLAGVVDDVRAVLGVLEAADLAAPRHLQGYDTDGAGVVFHVVEHMSYHTGQIVAATKQITGPGARIEFYPQHRGE